MAFFTKKPDVIEAVLWDGSNKDEIVRFCGRVLNTLVYEGESFVILTKDGMQTVRVGQYVVASGAGDFYRLRKKEMDERFNLVPYS